MLRAAILAREAQINPDGTFDVRGAGITEFQLSHGVFIGAPIRLQFAAVVRFEAAADEAGQLRTLGMSIFFENQRIGAPTAIPILARPVPGEPRFYHNVILNLAIDVPRPGQGFVEFTMDEGMTRIPHLHFRVGAPPSS